jgi:hypothetical protein
VTPGRAAAALAVYLASFLALDQLVGLHGQLLIGVLTWAVLLAACVPLSAERRTQVALVVAVATLAEVTGSIVWGVYRYRLGNLPLFVPPGHGLIYLTGLSLSRAVCPPRVLVRVALVVVLAWGVLGVTVLPRADWGGALGVVLLAAFLLRGRARELYAAVFLVVAAMELYGTWLGTWTWAATIPGTGIPDGNPPSGVASGYVWFDVVSLALAPFVLSLVRASRTRVPRLVPAIARSDAL